MDTPWWFRGIRIAFFVILVLEFVWAVMWVVGMFGIMPFSGTILATPEDSEALRNTWGLVALHVLTPLGIIALTRERYWEFVERRWFENVTAFVWFFFSFFVDLHSLFAMFFHVHGESNAWYGLGQAVTVLAVVFSGTSTILYFALFVIAANVRIASRPNDAEKENLLSEKERRERATFFDEMEKQTKRDRADTFMEEVKRARERASTANVPAAPIRFRMMK